MQYNGEHTIGASIEIFHSMWKSKHHRLTPKYEILLLFVPLVKNYHVTYVDDDDKEFRITCQNCNGYIKCADRSGELLSITYPHAGMYHLGL